MQTAVRQFECDASDSRAVYGSDVFRYISISCIWSNDLETMT